MRADPRMVGRQQSGRHRGGKLGHHLLFQPIAHIAAKLCASVPHLSGPHTAACPLFSDAVLCRRGGGPMGAWQAAAAYARHATI